MSKINEATLGLYLHELMRAKLGHHLDWQTPKLRDEVGPFNPSVFQSHDNQRRMLITNCEVKLREYSDNQILAIVNPKRDDPDDVVNEWTGFLRSEINTLEKRTPPWYAGGFGHPEYVADFKYWAQSRYFRSHEALFLSLGIEPSHFQEEHVIKISERAQKANQLWEPLVYMLRRREQIERQFPTSVHRNRIAPQEFFDWVQLVELDVHPELTSRYLKPDSEGAEIEYGLGTISTAQKKPDKREIDKIAQLFVAMAIGELGYDPTASRSPIPKEITDLAAGMGLDVSDDTVRKYLKLGAQFLPKEWEPN